ncbi:hypothetical protein M9H77_35414 [Catharanthus roseus]|uniref:Uncharacterized protein n=1 Tax=Catharanthus roseus TaxID=4058 RepID=A0ACB9ZQN7_CATRO|nr:hypothetical protein M9H77_35414 [Catharanthus roseus]
MSYGGSGPGPGSGSMFHYKGIGLGMRVPKGSGPVYTLTHIPYRFSAQEPLNEFSSPTRKLGVDFFDQIVGRVPLDSSFSTYGYIAIDYGVSSSKPFIGRNSRDMGLERDRGLGEEPDRFMMVMTLETRSSLCHWHLWHLGHIR